MAKAMFLSYIYIKTAYTIEPQRERTLFLKYPYVNPKMSIFIYAIYNPITDNDKKFAFFMLLENLT